MPIRPRFLSLGLFAICTVGAGCAGVTSGPAPITPTVTTTPGTANVRAGDTQTFTASVTGLASAAVTWSVNGVTGGNATVGTIDANGLFTAPATLPTPNGVTVQATSQADATKQGTSSVTLLNPIPVITSVTPNTIGVGSFTVVVIGSKFVNGAKIMFGGTPLTTTFNQSTYLAASGTATAAQAGTVNVTVQNPDPGLVASATSKPVTITTSGAVTTDAAAVRFLEQSTFGPTPQLVSQVKLTGFTPFLNDQFSAPSSTYPDPGTATGVTLTSTQQTFFTNALLGPDQLRQRVAFALSEIWVTSWPTIAPQGMAFYMRLLTQDAFVNYRQIMYDVTLSPAMGAYLNMVNNNKPSATTHANENYARELMQLFTLGLYKLNQDGSLQHDANGNPIPTYTQADVQALAMAFTGWTYPTMPSATQRTNNPTNWIGPMEGVDTNHDMTAKTFLGAALAANRTTAQDLGGTALNSSGALDVIFNNATLPPFVCKQLIQHLVTSNPSAAYVRRVADVFVSGNFASFGSGQRGDMQAVIAAILLDPEARRGDVALTSVATDGHLREPILYIANMLRAFGASSDGIGPVNNASNLSEPPLRSPSVFNFFPPDYQIPGSTLLGPEFSIQTTATAFARINLAYSFVFGSIGGVTMVDFTPYATIAASANGPTQLINALNTLLLHGTLSSSSSASILAAVNAVPTGTTQSMTQAKTAIYLILSSSQYQIEQ